MKKQKHTSFDCCSPEAEGAQIPTAPILLHLQTLPGISGRLAQQRLGDTDITALRADTESETPWLAPGPPQVPG